MTRSGFDQMMERNFKHFNVPEDSYGGLLLWIPKYKEFLSMHFGDGTNADELEEGCEDYIYYTQFDLEDPFEAGDEELTLEETDGGQMDIPSADAYNNDISEVIPDLLRFIYDDYIEVVPIQFYSVK